MTLFGIELLDSESNALTFLLEILNNWFTLTHAYCEPLMSHLMAVPLGTCKTVSIELLLINKKNFHTYGFRLKNNLRRYRYNFFSPNRFPLIVVHLILSWLTVLKHCFQTDKQKKALNTTSTPENKPFISQQISEEAIISPLEPSRNLLIHWFVRFIYFLFLITFFMYNHVQSETKNAKKLDVRTISSN